MNCDMVKEASYVIGHQRISQIVEKDGEITEHYFTFDGHGSTRVLVDASAAVAQIYAFDAYGNAIGFNTNEALTEFLYSGEQFDAKIGQQYLRARYYDPATGRFNRLDPFFGNVSDPQSFHKYLYTHADPINGIDPSGKFVAVTIGLLSGIGHALFMNAQKSSRDLTTGAMMIRSITTGGMIAAGYYGTFATYGIYGFSQGFKPLWEWSNEIDRPDYFENRLKSSWVNNIYAVLSRYATRINNISGGKINLAAAKREAKLIAEKYVEISWKKAKEVGILTDEFKDDPSVYGRSTSNSLNAWVRNAIDKRARCEAWADAIFLGLPELQHWTSTAYYDYIPMGDISLGFFMHSFVGVSLKGYETEIILDPWSSGYPHLYDANDYFSYHGKGTNGWEDTK